MANIGARLREAAFAAARLDQVWRRHDASQAVDREPDAIRVVCGRIWSTE
jgi:hypothetical protein